MKVKFGYCPYCGTTEYSRDTSEWVEDYVVLNCHCHECKESWTEYMQLDEVKFDKNGEEHIYTNVLSVEDKELIQEWAEQELKMKTKQFVNEDHEKDYKNRVKRVINLMKGGLERE